MQVPSIKGLLNIQSSQRDVVYLAIRGEVTDRVDARVYNVSRSRSFWRTLVSLRAGLAVRAREPVAKRTNKP